MFKQLLGSFKKYIINTFGYTVNSVAETTELSICVCVCIYMLTCIYKYTYICKYTDTHTYT